MFPPGFNIRPEWSRSQVDSSKWAGSHLALICYTCLLWPLVITSHYPALYVNKLKKQRRRTLFLFARNEKAEKNLVGKSKQHTVDQDVCGVVVHLHSQKTRGGKKREQKDNRGFSFSSDSQETQEHILRTFILYAPSSTKLLVCLYNVHDCTIKWDQKLKCHSLLAMVVALLHSPVCIVIVCINTMIKKCASV